MNPSTYVLLFSKWNCFPEQPSKVQFLNRHNRGPVSLSSGRRVVVRQCVSGWTALLWGEENILWVGLYCCVLLLFRVSLTPRVYVGEPFILCRWLLSSRYPEFRSCTFWQGRGTLTPYSIQLLRSLSWLLSVHLWQLESHWRPKCCLPCLWD